MSLSPAAETIRAAASDRIVDLARHFFGEPKRRERNALRWGGGIEVAVAGRHRGRFVAWGGTASGDGLALVRHALNCDFKAALAWTANYFGLPLADRPLSPEERRRLAAEAARRRREREAQAVNDDAARIAKALALWNAGSPLAGTLGDERYLAAIRGIPIPREGWPEALRWLARDRALIAAVTNVDGEVTATHRIFLTADGQNRRLPGGRKYKQTDGVRKGGVVRLPGRHGIAGPLLRGEGLETALSAWVATGHETWAVLGPLAQSEPPSGRIVIDLCDDHPPGDQLDASYRTTLAKWRGEGRRIAVATPWATPKFDKSDFNDVLRAEGLDAVRARIREAVLGAERLVSVPAPFALPTANLADIHARISAALRDFFARRFDDVAPQVLLAGATGSGKSHEILRRLAPMIEVDKAKGRPHRVIILAPAWRLGRQLVERCRAAAAAAGIELSVETYEGRGDPFAPAPPAARTYPCDDLAAVGLAITAGAEIGATVCGALHSDAQCRFRASCRYYAQLEAAKTADVLIVAHNFLFDALPEELRANVAAVVVEEDFSTHGLGTVTVPLGFFDDRDLSENPVLVKGDPQRPDHAATHDLDLVYAKIDSALAAAAAGEPIGAALAAAGLDAEALRTARRLSWRRKHEKTMRPGMPLDERRLAALAAAKINPLLKPTHALLSAFIAAMPAQHAPNFNASYQADTPPIEIADGKITVHRLHDLAGWLKERPMLIASATMREDLARRWFPRLERAAVPAPALPHQRVHQMLGAFGKTTIGKKLPDLVKRVRFQQKLGRRVLVISHLKDEPAFAAIRGQVATLHHGNLAGDNDFGDVDALFVIGGPFDKASHIARLASAETGRLVPCEPPVKTPCTGLLADGSGVQFDRMAYADPASQAVHQAIYDSGVVQALGRGRGLNRSAANPLDIYVFGNLPLPVPVEEIARWRPLSRLRELIGDGIVPANAADLVRFVGHLFPSRGRRDEPSLMSAAQALHRWGGVDGIRTEIVRLGPLLPDPWCEVTWQPHGQGHHPRRFFGPRPLIEAFREVAEVAFPEGLAHWSVKQLTAGRPPLPAGEEDHDSGEKEDFSPESLSSSPLIINPAAAVGAEPATAARAPPDG